MIDGESRQFRFSLCYSTALRIYIQNGIKTAQSTIDAREEYARGAIQYLIFFRWLNWDGRASGSTISLAFRASRIYRRDIIRAAKGRGENAAWQNMIAALNRVRLFSHASPKKNNG